MNEVNINLDYNSIAEQAIKCSLEMSKLSVSLDHLSKSNRFLPFGFGNTKFTASMINNEFPIENWIFI